MGGSSIRVEGLGKRYVIGERRQPYKRFTETVERIFVNSLRRVRGLSAGPRSSPTVWALRDVSFEVSQGEVLGIVGRNGAGKSTLLRILARVTPPTEGRAEIHGRLGSILEVGTGFHPELTGRENIYLNATILGMRRTEISRKLDEIVAFAEVEAFLDTPVKHYSSGMYVRLAFSVVAHLETDILIVDEALAVGDAAFQKKCLGYMRHAAHDEARTVLFVSHNLGALRALCDRALWIDHGRLRADGPAPSVIAAYLGDGGPADDGEVPPTAARLEGVTREARVVRVGLRDQRGAGIRQVFLGQPFRIVLVLEVETALPDAVVELGISTMDGLRVMTLNSIDGGKPAVYLAPGTHEIVVEVDQTLLPNEYALDVGLHHFSGGSALTVEWVERVLRFSALPVAEEGPDRYPWGVVRGFVRPPSVWHMPSGKAAPSSGTS